MQLAARADRQTFAGGKRERVFAVCVPMSHLQDGIAQKTVFSGPLFGVSQTGVKTQQAGGRSRQYVVPIISERVDFTIRFRLQMGQLCSLRAENVNSTPEIPGPDASVRVNRQRGNEVSCKRAVAIGLSPRDESIRLCHAVQSFFGKQPEMIVECEQSCSD